jgi:non-heme chloroperoxidase
VELAKLASRDVVLVADHIRAGNSPLVIFAHGGGQTRHSWRGAAERIAALGYETLSVDLRGHGESGWSAGDRYRLRDFADDLKAFAAEHRNGRPVGLIGASLGGHASLVAAGDPSAAIDLLVLVDVVPRVEMSGAARIRAFMERYPNGFASVDEAAEAVAGYRGGKSSSIDGLRRNLREAPSGRLVWHWDPAFLARRDPWPERIEQMEAAAANYHNPLLLVRGLESDVVSEAGIEALRALTPQLEEMNVANTGHMVVGDRNDVFVSGITPFLTRNLSINTVAGRPA